jgi:hypothetical protein
MGNLGQALALSAHGWQARPATEPMIVLATRSARWSGMGLGWVRSVPS